MSLRSTSSASPNTANNHNSGSASTRHVMAAERTGPRTKNPTTIAAAMRAMLKAMPAICGSSSSIATMNDTIAATMRRPATPPAAWPKRVSGRFATRHRNGDSGRASSASLPAMNRAMNRR